MTVIDMDPGTLLRQSQPRKAAGKSTFILRGVAVREEGTEKVLISMG